MSLTQILLISAACLVGGRLFPFRWKYWSILAVSVIGIFWLQPLSPIRDLSFWLPLGSICLVILVWAVTRNSKPLSAADKYTGLVVVIIVLTIGSLRYLPSYCCITAERPPQLSSLLIALGLVLGIIILLRFLPSTSLWQWSLFIGLIIIFIVIKYPWLTEKAARLLRVANHQDANLASLNDLQWLGFSYLAFRLLHVLRDHQIQKSQGQKLSDLLSYALFLPAYVAGPIDRSQRFIADLSSPQNVSKPKNRDVDITEGVKRIIVGLFSKFVLADSFALLALNPINALEIRSTFWSWVALYGYTLRIFFDFSGYTDIAIGAGKLLGITLPENFDSPYKKTSLIAFWNSWHITLAQWFRAYFFNPLTRAMRMKKNVFPLWSIIFLGQVTTMLLIGLWHGITWNFAIWGLWHGFGLFVNNRWGDWFRVHGQEINISHNKELILKFSGWLLTFHFVTLGWVWFVIPDPLLALKIFQHLVGIYR